MTVYTPDGLFLFGSNQTAEVPSTPGSANHATPKAPLGALYRENGKVWRYVQFKHAVTGAAYVVVHWHALDPPNGIFEVTADYSEGIGANLVAGVMGGSVTANYYTWIQVGGICTAYIDFSTLTGDPVAAAVPGIKMMYTSTDTKFSAIDAGDDNHGIIFGIMIATGNYTAGTGQVLLQNLDW